MTLYIFRRLLQSIGVIFIVTALVFVGIYVIGNPVDILVSTEADQEQFDRMVKNSFWYTSQSLSRETWGDLSHLANPRSNWFYNGCRLQLNL